jgi:hypothetical protein
VIEDVRRVYEKRISLSTFIRAEMKGVWCEVNWAGWNSG